MKVGVQVGQVVARGYDLQTQWRELLGLGSRSPPAIVNRALFLWRLAPASIRKNTYRRESAPGLQVLLRHLRGRLATEEPSRDGQTRDRVPRHHARESVDGTTGA